MGPIPISIPLKLFLDGVDFPAGNVISRVEWKILGKENSKMLVNAKLEQDL